MKFCPECGYKFGGNVKFCPECGFKIEKFEEIQSEEKDVRAKYESSEEMIKSHLKNTYEKADIFVAPDIPGKKLVNAANTIGKGVNTMEVVALIDTTILHTGKEGILFMGDKVFMRAPFGTPICVEFSTLDSVSYEERETKDSNNKVKVEKILCVKKKTGESEYYTSQVYGFDFPLQLVSQILSDVLNNVENIESTNQLLRLRDLGDESVSLYLKIIMNYLREDDGIIDNFEYKELIGLMGRLNVSNDLAAKLRDYRIDAIPVDTDELLMELKSHIPSGSVAGIFQSLLKDILSIRKGHPEDWKGDSIFLIYQEKLKVSDAQVNFFVRNLLQDRRIIAEKIDDNKIKGMMSELSAVGAAAGVSLTALAATGAITGFGGVSGGLLAICFSTGGAIGLTAIAGLGYGAYRGVKYFAGSSEEEKYGIRSAMLQQKIKELQNSQNYLIEDINWTTSKIATLLEKKDEILNNYDQLLEYVQMSQKLDEGSRLMLEEEKITRISVYRNHVPEQLEIDKYRELVKQTEYQAIYDEFIFSCYKQNDQGQYILTDIQDEECLEKLDQVIENIGYYDTAKATVAKTNAMVKRGLTNLKGMFND